MSLILSGDTGVPVTTVTGTLPVANGGSGVTTSTGSGANVLGTSPSISGAVMSTMASSVLTSGTAQASTSGTSIDFTSIPSWVKRITVMFNGVSTNGTSVVQVQLGSSTIQTSGYAGGSSFVNGTNSCNWAAFTAGFGINMTSASAVRSGQLTITNVSGNIWSCSGVIGDNIVSTSFTASVVTLSGVLDRVRITTVNGTDTFDAGSINILYE